MEPRKVRLKQDVDAVTAAWAWAPVAARETVELGCNSDARDLEPREADDGPDCSFMAWQWELRNNRWTNQHLRIDLHLQVDLEQLKRLDDYWNVLRFGETAGGDVETVTTARFEYLVEDFSIPERRGDRLEKMPVEETTKIHGTGKGTKDRLREEEDGESAFHDTSASSYRRRVRAGGHEVKFYI